MAIWLCLLTLGANFAEFGPYRVGSMTIIIVDTDRDRTLVTEVWYPAAVQDGLPAPEYPSGAVTVAIRDAKPVPQQFPLVIFSHGLASIREQSTFLTEHLASHGYVVASPDHQNNTGRDLKPFGLFQSARDRPVDVKVVINHLLRANRIPQHLLHGTVDEDKIAVMGHSLGGYTALAAAGAWVNAKSLNNGSKPEYYNFADPRIKAAIAYMPVFDPYFDAPGLQKLQRPALIIAGSDDRVTPYEKTQRPLFQHLQAPKVLALISGATHFSLLNEEVVEQASLVVRAMHQPRISREQADAEIRQMTLAFFEYYLKGDPENLHWLRQSRPNVEVIERLDPGDLDASASPSESNSSSSKPAAAFLRSPESPGS